MPPDPNKPLDVAPLVSEEVPENYGATSCSSLIEPDPKAEAEANALVHAASKHELRELGVRSLSLRRDLRNAEESRGGDGISSVQKLPEFGRVLVHLSNERCALSWIRSSGQLFIFSLAITRLPSQLSSTYSTRAVATVLVVMGVFVLATALADYLHVRDTPVPANRNLRKRYMPTLFAPMALAATAFAAAACALFVVVQGIRELFKR